MPDAKGFYETAASPGEYFFVTEARSNSAQSHFHNSVEVVIAVDDGFHITVNGEEFVLDRYDVAVINRFDIHYFPMQNLRTHAMVIGENYCSRFYQSAGDRVFPTVLRNNGKAADEFMPLVLFMCKQGFYAEELMKYGFADMFFGILKKYYPLVPRRIRSNTHLISEILQYIQKDLTQELTLSGIAEKFGYSKTYLSALFNEYLGMHFREYINRLRVDLALGMLADKEKNGETVLSISGKCGFDSPNTFYRAMKKYAPKKS